MATQGQCLDDDMCMSACVQVCMSLTPGGAAESGGRSSRGILQKKCSKLLLTISICNDL